MIKLAHVCIESANLDATQQFYSLLGMTLKFDFRNLQGEPIGYYLRFDNDSFIEVVRVAEVKPEGKVMHFAIETHDIDGLRERLIAGGYEPSMKRLGGDQTWVVTCRDPSGILVELHEYAEESMQYYGGTCLLDYKF